jgi:hypothetical protein
MSYESRMLQEFNMPSRKDVEKSLLVSLLKHNGVIKEFGAEEEIVNEIANEFGLNDEQRNVVLERVYLKENRIVKSPLWHRLLYRAANSLSEQELVSNPKSTFKLINRKEWMLTELGIDKALKNLKIPRQQKDFLTTKTYEVQKVVKKLKTNIPPKNYNPIDKEKKLVKVARELTVRERGFRQAVIEAYSFRCCICGMKINSPDSLTWEVEAAHIVPHRLQGKDDIWNGISFCRLHHWAFDVGWFTLLDDYKIQVSERIDYLPSDFGRQGDYYFLKMMLDNKSIHLPLENDNHPHQNAILWHRENIFYH